MATAQMNIGDLRKVLGMPAEADDSPPAPPSDDDSAPRTPFNALRVRRQSMEQLSLIQVSIFLFVFIYIVYLKTYLII